MTGSRYGDYSRSLFDPGKHYSRVLMQQGRIQLDADWNAQADIAEHRLRTAGLDMIGEAGGPAGNAGFEVQPRYALRFDGGQLATVGGTEGPLFAPAGGLTLELWARPDAAGTLLSRASRRLDDEAFREDLALEVSAEGRVRCHRSGTAHPDLETATAVRFGQPVQLAVACHGHETRLYVNGRLAARDDHGCPPAGEAETALLLGASLVDGAPANLFRGLLYELRCWGVARREEEIRATLRQAPARGEPELLGWWRFDQGHGSVVADRSRHGNPCLLGGGRGDDDSSRPRWALRELLIGQGRYYVDGILCASEATVPWSQQPDLPGAALPPLDGSRRHLIYLDVWERSVTAVEDPSLLEPALGGADTTTRSRVVAQVKWQPLRAGPGDGTGTGAAAAGAGELPEWRQLLARERERGQLRARRRPDAVGTLGNQLYRVEIHAAGAGWGRARPAAARAVAVAVEQIVPTARQVRLAAAGSWTPGDWVELFGPPEEQRAGRGEREAEATAGVLARITTVADDGATLGLGVEASPLIRLAAEGGTQLRRVASFKWSRNNASPAWGIARAAAGSELLVLADSGRDDLELARGDWVEILDDRLVLAGGAVRLHQVESVDLDQRQVTLTAPLAAAGAPDPRLHPLLRRWDQRGDGGGGDVPIRFGWMSIEAGIEVSFAPEAVYRCGDFWWLPARTLTEAVEWPGGGAEPEPRGPDGIDHHYAPLALLASDAEGLRCQDWRTTFRPLATGAVSKAGDTMDGPLAVRADVTVGGELRAGAIFGPLAEPGAVGSEALADGAVTAAKLAGGIGTVPPGAAIFTGSPQAPAGYRATSFTTTLFDPAARWIPRRELPRPAGGGLASVAIAGSIFTLLGSGELWEYDPGADRWLARRPLPAARQGCGMAALAGQLYACGGLGGEGTRDGATLAYDPAADEWRQRRPMPTPRSDLAAAAAGGGLYATGGLRDSWLGTSISRHHEVYDPERDVWTAARPLPEGRAGLGAAVLGDRIHVAGGLGPTFFGLGRALRGSHLSYSPIADRWQSERAPLPAPRAAAGVAASAGRLYLIGGRGPAGDLAEVDEYDPAFASWTPRAPLPRPLAGPAAAALGGTLYVTGGASGPDSPTIQHHECALAAVLWLHEKTPE
jgi:hypothetical protein